MQDWVHATAASCLLELDSQLCSLLVWGEAYPLCVLEWLTEYVTAELCRSLLMRSMKSSIGLTPSEMGIIPLPPPSEYGVERGLKDADIPLPPSTPVFLCLVLLPCRVFPCQDLLQLCRASFRRQQSYLASTFVLPPLSAEITPTLLSLMESSVSVRQFPSSVSTPSVQESLWAPETDASYYSLMLLLRL
jgi:hypothetical protein